MAVLMRTQKAGTARTYCLILATCSLALAACESSSSSPTPTASGSPGMASTTAGAKGAASAPAASAAAGTVTRETLCARAADCHIEVSKEAAKQLGADVARIEREADKLRAHASTQCMAAAEKATPDAMAGCMKLACNELLPCVGTLAKAK